MFKRLRALRTNENILIAADVLLSSKSSFMNVFLMAYMINVSLQSSPASFIVYCIVRYAAMGIFAICLLNFYRKHTLTAWRISMVFSVLEVLAIIIFDSTAFYYPYILAILSATEASMYWRPKMYFDVTEVSDARRLRFRSIATILTEIVKIFMPIILGIAIGATGYTNAAFIVLSISAIQLVLSLCFHPNSVDANKKPHKIKDVYCKIIQHESLRKIMALSFVRGLVVCSSAYLVISQIILYRNVDSETDLGIFTSLAAVIAVISVFVYRKLKTKRAQKTMLLALLPATILLPLFLIIFPKNSVIAIALYVFIQSIVCGLFDGTVTMTRLQGILSSHLKDPSYRMEVECLAEVSLTLSRIIGFTILLFFISMGWEQYIIWLALIESFFIIPWYFMAIPKSHSYN